MAVTPSTVRQDQPPSLCVLIVLYLFIFNFGEKAQRLINGNTAAKCDPLCRLDEITNLVNLVQGIRHSLIVVTCCRDCTIADANPLVRDRDLGEELWRLSDRWTGLSSL